MIFIQSLQAISMNFQYYIFLKIKNLLLNSNFRYYTQHKYKNQSVNQFGRQINSLLTIKQQAKRVCLLHFIIIWVKTKLA